MSKETSKVVNILDVLIILARHKFFIIKVVFSITLIALVISLLWPKTYKSSSTFIPATTDQPALPSGVAGLLGGAMQMPTSYPQLNSEVLINLLHSRSLREDVIHEFNFREIYGIELMEELLKRIDKNIVITENREGGFGFNPIYSISLSFISDDPERSYQVNQYILDLLNRKAQQINLENANEQLNILESRYHRSLEDLEAAEDTLVAFQEKYGIMEVEEQAKQIVNKLADLKAGSIETEMKINVLSQTVSPNNPELRNLERAKQEYDRQFNELMRRSEETTVQTSGFYPLLDLPELAATYMRLYREVEIQNRILETIYPQYESQKMVVEANRRSIQVIDPPVVPTYKDGPKRAFIVLGGMFFSIFLSFTIVFFREMAEHGRKHNTENYRRLQELSGHFRFRKKKSSDSDKDS